MKDKSLYLPLKAKWYNMIESGEKLEEYREINDYWCKRLLVNPNQRLYTFDGEVRRCEDVVFKKFSHSIFRYGYTKRTVRKEIKSITIGRGNPNWGAPTDRDVFIIKFK